MTGCAYGVSSRAIARRDRRQDPHASGTGIPRHTDFPHRIPSECLPPADLYLLTIAGGEIIREKEKSSDSIQQSLQFYPQSVQNANLGCVHSAEG